MGDDDQDGIDLSALALEHARLTEEFRMLSSTQIAFTMQLFCAMFSYNDRCASTLRIGVSEIAHTAIDEVCKRAVRTRQ